MKVALTCRRAAARLTLATLPVLGLVAPTAWTATPAAASANTVVTENQQPGTTAWQIGALVADDANGQVKGYASATSVNHGQDLSLYVTVNPPQTYTIDFYRIGWYGGLGGRLLSHVGPLSGTTQAPCLPDATTGLIACNWAAAYTLTVPADWTSGVYLGLLTNAAGYQNYVVFVVKDGRPAPYLFQASMATYEAYNNYPDDQLNGKSLYGFNSYGAPTVANDVRAVKVSFDRPYAADGSGHFLWWEVQFVRFVERLGYDVTYSTDLDTHENGAALLNSKALLAVGHDEYWSKEMRDAVEAARNAGVSLGFFGSNDDFWQVRFEPSAGGTADRVMVCYKDPGLDPIQGPTSTVNFRSAPVNRPEQSLIGIQFTSSVPWGNNASYLVLNGLHWAYSGSSTHDADMVPGLVGYEMDRMMPDYPLPASRSQTLLSKSPYVSSGGLPDFANSSIYQAPSGAWVFAAGTTSWNLGLDSWNSTIADPRIQQTTANLLNAFVSGAPASLVPNTPLPALPPGVGASPAMVNAIHTSQAAIGLGLD